MQGNRPLGTNKFYAMDALKKNQTGGPSVRLLFLLVSSPSGVFKPAKKSVNGRAKQKHCQYTHDQDLSPSDRKDRLAGKHTQQKDGQA